MTINQCYNYSIIAIKYLQNNKIKIAPRNFYYQLYHLCDIYSEEEIEKIVKRIEENE